MRESEERLRQADHQKNQFLAMLGHELRNPLAAIRGGVNLLRSEKTSLATRASTLPLVSQQVEHMEQLIDDLLDVASIVEGKLKVRLQPVAVQHAVTNAIQMVRSKAEAANFELRVSVPADPVVVLGDLVRLTQIFVNLLKSCSSKTMPPSRRFPAVNCAKFTATRSCTPPPAQRRSRR